MTEAIESVSPLLAQRGHHLKRTGTAERAVVAGDATRLAQIIGNLLHNAAQYTPPGGHLEVASALDGDNVIVQVRDDGEGIPPEMLSEIFELFSQKGRSLARSEGGLGLGLALVKALTELHGGSVSVSSRGDGLGSEFAVRRASESQRSPAPSRADRG